MANMTTFLRNGYRGEMRSTATAFTVPTGRFVQLHNGAPGLDGTANVIAVARQSTTLVDGTGDGTLTNSNELVYAGMPAGNVTHWSIHSAVTGGSALFQGALVTPRTTGAGDTLRIPIGELDITYS